MQAYVEENLDHINYRILAIKQKQNFHEFGKRNWFYTIYIIMVQIFKIIQ